MIELVIVKPLEWVLLETTVWRGAPRICSFWARVAALNVRVEALPWKLPLVDVQSPRATTVAVPNATVPPVWMKSLETAREYP